LWTILYKRKCCHLKKSYQIKIRSSKSSLVKRKIKSVSIQCRRDSDWHSSLVIPRSLLLVEKKLCDFFNKKWNFEPTSTSLGQFDKKLVFLTLIVCLIISQISTEFRKSRARIGYIYSPIFDFSYMIIFTGHIYLYYIVTTHFGLSKYYTLALENYFKLIFILWFIFHDRKIVLYLKVKRNSSFNHKQFEIGKRPVVSLVWYLVLHSHFGMKNRKS